MASSSDHGAGITDGATSNDLTVVRIIPTTRDPSLFTHFDLCEMSNGSQKARCKNCGTFLAASSNSTLRAHLGKHCKALKGNPSRDQAHISRDAGVWMFDAEMVRQRMACFVIQEALPFDHFDNPRLTKLIQDTLQPRYTIVSRTTLRRDCLKLWMKAKKETIKGFEILKMGVNLTTDVWSAPFGLPDSYICVTAHWIDPNSWQMMKHTIAFELFGYPHTGENIFYVLDQTIQTFKLENKILSISFDNAWAMFDSAVQQMGTLQPFHDSLASSGLVVEFSNRGWRFVRSLTKFLEVFKDATTILSGVYYPTSCLVLKQLYLMCCKVNDFEFEGEVYETMVVPMKTKFRKYFEEMPPVFSCAAALNPCLNVGGVEMLITNICSDLELDAENPHFSNNAINNFNNYLNNIFEVYLKKYGNVSNIQESMAKKASSSRGDPELNLYNSLRNEFSKRSRGGASNSELGRYKSTDFLASMSHEMFHNFDILAWWKERESQFPVLAAMARDLLSVQASTVASESAFSLSGRVLSIRRTQLTPQAMKMCICLKDYLDGAERIQDRTNLEGEMAIEEHIHDYEVYKGRAQPLSDEENTYDEAMRSSARE